VAVSMKGSGCRRSTGLGFIVFTAEMSMKGSGRRTRNTGRGSFDMPVGMDVSLKGYGMRILDKWKINKPLYMT